MGSVLSAERVAVIGDVGGHRDELQRELARLGADHSTGRLPDGLVVVQVGDLIHRGPDSGGVIELVDGYLRTQPDQWVQLVGNHEAQYLRPPAFDWPETLGRNAIGILRRWWADGQLVAAVSITPFSSSPVSSSPVSSSPASSSPASSSSASIASERLIISHAGLTSGFWRRVLGEIDDPAKAAAAMNSFIGTHEDVLFHAGQMLGGGKPDPLAGPIWATAATELVPSWLGVPMPFSQIHGHTRIISDSGRSGASALTGPARSARSARSSRLKLRSGRSAQNEQLEQVTQLTTVDELSGHETTTLDGGHIIGIDPGHTRRARPSWRAWELNEPAELHT